MKGKKNMRHKFMSLTITLLHEKLVENVKGLFT